MAVPNLRAIQEFGQSALLQVVHAQESSRKNFVIAVSRIPKKFIHLFAIIAAATGRSEPGHVQHAGDSAHLMPDVLGDFEEGLLTRVHFGRRNRLRLFFRLLGRSPQLL